MKCGQWTCFSNFSPEFGFSHFFSKTLLNAKIFSAYSYFFMRNRRTQGNFLNVNGEYGEFRVVCCTQNLLRIRGKNLCLHREDAKRYKTVHISVNNYSNVKVF